MAVNSKHKTKIAIQPNLKAIGAGSARVAHQLEFDFKIHSRPQATSFDLLLVLILFFSIYS
jgi:hypothetical protein